ncbi:hypothetical protein M378DRAFT_24971 [Amanita muscaria Koide BX008]|uniref:Uncharacterized protein n=1 Tax=Amanita muscaria (strain Koide BX008) TaxID=946122 RepID=A0A0C2X4J1_AMAMK|nr:hypothetical protein M378DRAFT_24971 [Amanita muscaria Koide BX008]
MLQENTKRAATTSPVGCPIRHLKRLHLATDLWSEAEHLQQDAIVNERLLGKRRTYNSKQEVHMGCVLNLVADVVSQGPHPHLFHLRAANECIDALEEDSDFMKLVGDCYTNGSYKNVRCHEFLLKNPASAFTQNCENKVANTSSSYSATEKAWNEQYIGSAADRFYDTIKGQCTRGDPVVYARYASILQSSGMGKSRMIDELSKKHLVLPINLRPSSDEGFPAADVDVRIFLTVGETEKDNMHRRYRAFLIALFITARRYLQNIDQHIADELPLEQSPHTIAEKFRLLMTAGQTFKRQGGKRCEFYSAVVKYANQLLQPPIISVPLKSSIRQATSTPFTRGGEQLDIRRTALDLLKCLDPILKDANLETLPPLVVLAFDEAHVLSVEKHQFDTAYFSEFSELRRALRALNELPIFSVFLSTSGQIQNITPPAEGDASSRVQKSKLVLLAPFTELGFDQMVKEEISDGALTIEDVTTIEFMARFGRPLFGSRYINGDTKIQDSIVYYAGEKLLGGVAFPHDKKKALSKDAKLACMAVRLALEFNATTLASQNREMTQVEKHMRVCLVMNPGFETAVTTAPSEPLLAQAAYLLMQDRNDFDLPRTLLEELQKLGLNKVDRGELICLVLLLIARDVAVQEKGSAAIGVLFFMEKLLASRWSSMVFDSKPARCRTSAKDQLPFSEVFAKSKIYFNHFVKVHDFKVIHRAFLWRLIARGAAVLCADNQDGIDVVLPFLYLDDRLGRDNVSAIFIQVKNNGKFSSTPNLFLFDAMNPYFLGFFDMDEQKPVPIIRMVFALASSESCVMAVEDVPLRTNPPRRARSKGKDRARPCPAYTAFDIWCAGTTAETFSVVKPGDEQVYSDLLKPDRLFPGVYEEDTEIDSTKSARRNMNPGTAAHPDHWTKFSTKVTEPDRADGVDFDCQDEVADDDVEMRNIH